MTRNFLVVSPHPDDAELAIAGTIAKLSRSKNNAVYLLDLTDGEPTPCGNATKRKKEAAAAAAILGVKQRITLDFPNRYLEDTDAPRLAVAKYIRRFRPQAIFAPYFEDAHPDHIACSKIVDNARFFAKLVKINLPFKPWYVPRVFYYFSLHLRILPPATFLTDTSGFFDKKLKSIKAFRSQFIDNPQNKFVIGAIRDLNRLWGRLINTEYAEAFYLREALRIDDISAIL